MNHDLPVWHLRSILCSLYPSNFKVLQADAHFFVFDYLGPSGPKFLLSEIKRKIYGAWFFFWCTYRKRFNPTPYYHCESCTLIRCAGTLEPWMHGCVARNKVIEILLLMYPHVLQYGRCRFLARRLAIIFRLASASTPSNPSTEGGGGVGKFRHLWRQASSYIFS